MADTVEPNGPAATDLPIVGNENLKPPKGAENDGRVPGTPTIPMCARSVVTGTSRGNNNKKLTHVCGFIDEISLGLSSMSLIRSFFNTSKSGGKFNWYTYSILLFIEFVSCVIVVKRQ
jgi:hypothetical protein